MKQKRRAMLLLSLSSLTMAAASPTTAPPSPAALRVGAARIDITPPLEQLPKPFTKVESAIFLRAVVLESAGRRAVIIIADVPTISAPVAATIVGRISQET